MTRMLHRPSTEKFSYSIKYSYSYGLHNCSRNIFVNTSEWNWFIIFLIMLPTHVQGTWLKFLRNIEIKNLFHFKAHFHVRTFQTSRLNAFTKWLLSMSKSWKIYGRLTLLVWTVVIIYNFGLPERNLFCFFVKSSNSTHATIASMYTIYNTIYNIKYIYM